MLDTRVLSLGVFSIECPKTTRCQHFFYPYLLPRPPSRDSPDQDRVDIIVRRLVPLDAHTRPDVGKQPKRPPQRQVHRDVSLSDRGGQGSLERDGVPLDGSDGVGRDSGLSVDQGGGHIDFLPHDRGLGSAKDGFDGFGNLGTDTVTGHEGDAVLALRACVRACKIAKVSALHGERRVKRVVRVSHLGIGLDGIGRGRSGRLESRVGQPRRGLFRSESSFESAPGSRKGVVERGRKGKA